MPRVGLYLSVISTDPIDATRGIGELQRTSRGSYIPEIWQWSPRFQLKMMRLGVALFGVVVLDGVVGQDGPSCAMGGNVAVNVGGTDGNVVTTVDIPAVR